VIGAALMGALVAGPIAADPLGQITEVAVAGETPGFTADPRPSSIVTGPDGNLWFLERNTNSIARVTPGGVVTEFPTGLPGFASLNQITNGPDGALWFTAFNPPGAVGRITTDGVVTIVATGGVTPGFPSANVQGITTGPDGNIWVALPFAPPGIARITPGGIVTTFGVANGLAADAEVRYLVTGPDGALWISDNGTTPRMWRFDVTTNAFSVLATAGSTPGFPAGTGPNALVLGPDGNVWALAGGVASAVVRFTAAGEVTTFTAGIGADFFMQNIAAGCDDALWFTVGVETDSPPAVGRITLDGTVTLFTDGLRPGSSPDGITNGPDGNIWFTSGFEPGVVARIGAGDAPGCLPPPEPAVVVPTFTG
jgi:virginiamycin B lyase